MIYCETVNTERIIVHPTNGLKDTGAIEIIRYGDESIFAVELFDGEESWYWEFDLSCPSDYERIKLTIFDVVYVCNTMPELAEGLDEIFKDIFKEILISDYDYDCECCGSCNYCDE